MVGECHCDHGIYDRDSVLGSTNPTLFIVDTVRVPGSICLTSARGMQAEITDNSTFSSDS